MSELFKFTPNIKDRIKNLESYIDLLKEERELTEESIKDIPSINRSEKLELISLKKRIGELDQEILSKTEFVNKLRKKLELDEKEFRKNLIEARLKSDKLIKEAEKFLEEEENNNNGMLTFFGNQLQFHMNNLLIAKEEKDEGSIVWYYNVLEKQMSTKRHLSR